MIDARRKILNVNIAYTTHVLRAPNIAYSNDYINVFKRGLYERNIHTNAHGESTAR